MKHFTKCLKLLLLALCVVGGARSAWAETVTWEKTDISDLTTGDVVVIVDQTSVTALPNNNGTSSAPSATAVTLSDDKAEITGTVGDALQWEITVTNGSYKFNVPGTQNYLYCTAANNGVRVGTNSNNAFTWESNFLKNTATSRYVGVYSSQDWRCYTSINTNIQNCVTAFYKKVVAGETSATLSSIALSGDYPKTFNEGAEFSHEGVIVTATYDDASPKDVTAKATFSGYDMNKTGSQTVTVSYTEGGEIKTATYNITVNALPTHTVTWSVNGATTSETFKEGVAITFPEDPEVDGKSFYGWTTAALVGVTDEAPETVSSATMGNADVTYYAVFADRVAGDQKTATDVLTRETTGVTENSYESWSEKTVETSDAVYAGHSAGGNESIQLRSTLTSNKYYSGVISTTTGGKLQKVVVTWTSQTGSNRTLDVYGSNTAYSSADDLYNDTAKGTLLGSIVRNQSSGSETDELTIDGDYTYIGFRSASGALYLSSVSITWTSGTPDTYSAFCTTVAEDTRAEAGISFAEAAVTKEIVADYTGQALTNPNSLSVTWTSSNEEVATVEDGVLTIKTVGETTITATFAGNEDYKAGTASYTLTIQDSREAIELSFAAASVDVNVDESVDAPALNGNTGNGAITYESSDEDIALVDPSTGEVSGVADGTATITATVAATNEYQGGTATFTVNVIDPNKKGTANNPYTVAQAIDAIDNSGDVTGVYVTGIVSQVDSYNNGAITYWISADGTTTDQFEVYRGKNTDGASFSSKDDVQVGDVVLVKGNIVLYNSSIYEFSANSQIVSLSRKSAATITVTGGTAFTINRENNEEELTLTATANSGATVTFSVDTDNTTIDAQNYAFENGTLLVSGTKGGVIVIKANAEAVGDYKAAEEVTITVTVVGIKADATIVVADDEVAYGETFTVDTDAIEGGAITVTSSNTAVATVDGLVITPAAVGTTTITVATAEDETYKSGSKTFTLTVTAPEGSTEAAPTSVVVFNETFAESTGTLTEFGNTDGNGTFAADNEWNTENPYGAEGAAKFGASKKKGSATTPAISATVGAVYTLTFKAAPWAAETTTMSVSVNGGNITGVSEDEMTTGKWNDYTAEITATEESFTVTFAASANRFFLDDVKIESAGYVATVTFNASGYATFCSPYPLDFQNAPGVDAYFVSEVNGTQINFKEWDSTVKGGTPLFLVGVPGSTVTIPSVDSENVPDVNRLVGTLAPTYVETVNGAYTNFGLSGENFVKINGGVVKAGKAYLPVLTETLPAQGAKLRLVFTDSTTGIATVKEVPAAALDGILYNLSGQRVGAGYKGIVIKNGKKYLNK